MFNRGLTRPSLSQRRYFTRTSARPQDASADIKATEVDEDLSEVIVAAAKSEDAAESYSPWSGPPREEVPSPPPEDDGVHPLLEERAPGRWESIALCLSLLQKILLEDHETGVVDGSAAGVVAVSDVAAINTYNFGAAHVRILGATENKLASAALAAALGVPQMIINKS